MTGPNYVVFASEINDLILVVLIRQIKVFSRIQLRKFRLADSGTRHYVISCNELSREKYLPFLKL